MSTKLRFYEHDGTIREPDKEITLEEWNKLKPSERWEYDSKTYSKEPTGICDHGRLGWEPCCDGENGYCCRMAGVCSSQLKMDGSGEMNDSMANLIISAIAKATNETEDIIRNKCMEVWRL